MSARLERRGGVIVEISGEIETVKAGHPRCRTCGRRLKPAYDTTTGETAFEGKISVTRPSGAGWKETDRYSPNELARYGLDPKAAHEAMQIGVRIWTRMRKPVSRRAWLGRFAGIDDAFCNNGCAAAFGRIMARTKRGWAVPAYFKGREDELRRVSELEGKIG